MIRNNTVICSNCVYWEQEDPKVDRVLKEHNVRLKEPIIQGKCRRYPPQVINTKYAGQVFITTRTEDKDWCGEFRKK